MKRMCAMTLILMTTVLFVRVAAAQDVTVVVKGIAWDSDSRGFAAIGGLSKRQGRLKAARRGSRISVDGHPEVFAISGEGGEFEFAVTTSESSFRLIVEGDRFPRTITQSFSVPEGGGELDVGSVSSPRAEGGEHTWPLSMVATALGYVSTREMLADNKSAIRILIRGSGADGAPRFTNDAKITFPTSGSITSTAEPTTASPFLMRVPQSEYLVPFWMTPQDTYFELSGPTHGAYIVIVSFSPDDGPDKDVVIQIEDSIANELLEPARPWKFSPKTVSVRRGFATEVRYEPDIE